MSAVCPPRPSGASTSAPAAINVSIVADVAGARGRHQQRFALGEDVHSDRRPLRAAPASSLRRRSRRRDTRAARRSDSRVHVGARRRAALSPRRGRRGARPSAVPTCRRHRPRSDRRARRGPSGRDTAADTAARRQQAVWAQAARAVTHLLSRPTLPARCCRRATRSARRPGRAASRADSSSAYCSARSCAGRRYRPAPPTTASGRSIVRVQVRVAQRRPVEEQRVIEQIAVALAASTASLSRNRREQLRLVGVELRVLLDATPAGPGDATACDGPA